METGCCVQKRLIIFQNHRFKPIVEYGSQHFRQKQLVVENKILKKKKECETKTYESDWRKQ
jgi:hypothetical protein